MDSGWTNYVVVPLAVLGALSLVRMAVDYAEGRRRAKIEAMEKRRDALSRYLTEYMMDATRGCDLGVTIPGIRLCIHGGPLTEVAKRVFNDLYNLREGDVVEDISATVQRSWRLGGLIFFAFQIPVRGSYVRDPRRAIDDMAEVLLPFIDAGVSVRLELDRPPVDHVFKRDFAPCCLDLTKWEREMYTD
jgi:hypothetical protein